MTLGRDAEPSSLAPLLDEERVERLWVGTMDYRRRRRIRVRAALVVVVVGLLAGVTTLGLRGRVTRASEIVAEKREFSLRSVDGAEVLELADGSVVVAEQGTRLSVMRADAMNVLVSLEMGGIEVTAQASAHRSFSVRTTLGTIETRGGRFDARVSGQRLVVDVLGGEVALHRTGAASEHLGAGARWQSSPPVESPTATTAPTVPTASPSPVIPSSARAEAAQLLERADAARLARDAAGAARLLDELRTRFPTDPNAGLAAFEAGRIHLRRSEAARAADAFRFAVDHAEDAFREDAEAGLAEALSDAAKHPDCTEARDAYLQRYPLGAHRARVGALCR